jgi:hypothetical protein
MAKQNIESIRSAHYHRNGTNPDGSGKSNYAKKVREGKQMYGAGPGPNSCCAHRIRLAGER